MTWQYNPSRGDITDPDAEELNPGCFMMARGDDGLCVPVAHCPSCDQQRRRAYYGGELIAETVRSTHGPMLAEAQNMLNLLKRYVSDDPCSAGDPRYSEAVAIIERIEPKPKQPNRCIDCGKEIPESKGKICDDCISF